MGKFFTKDELNKVLENHLHWVKGDCDGWSKLKANLYGANLYGADLCGANLCGADLRGADLYGANLRGADLYGANLYGADLCGADLCGANLYGANLYGANLYGANLYGADLCGANLYGADLRGAKNVPFIPIVCPDTGEFIAWKKCRLGSGDYAECCIVKLLIPGDAKRSSATGRKCRCDKAVVLRIESLDGSVAYTEARSDYDYEFVYKVAETVSVDNFDEDRFNECAPGIHFFINRQEAMDYLL